MPMTTTPSTPRQDANDTGDESADILVLLCPLQFEHWYCLIDLLCKRFDGWYAAYEGSDESTPDYRPLYEVIAALRGFPVALAGDDSALARVLVGCEFICRSARSCWPSTIAWNPMDEPFLVFAGRHGRPYPYWASEPILPVQVWVNWLLSQLPEPGARERGT